MSTVTIVEIDQYMGPSPHALSKTPMPWADFMTEVQLMLANPAPLAARPRIKDIYILDNYACPWGHSAYRDVDGYVALWRANWDSSG